VRPELINTDGGGQALVGILTGRNYYTGHQDAPSAWPVHLVLVDA
jgi:hypothetical protein